MIPHIDLSIETHADVARARAAALQVVHDHHLDDSERGRIGAIVTELAKHLLADAIDGRMLIGCHAYETGAQVEVLAIDHGSRHQGLHTGWTDGSPLALVRALSNEFASVSVKGKGTVTLSRTSGLLGTPAGMSAPATRIRHAGISLKKEETQGRSQWFIEVAPAEVKVVVVEPSAIGTAGARASEIVANSCKTLTGSPSEIVREIQRLTADASIFFAEAAVFDAAKGTILFAGTGELTARVISSAHPCVLQSLVDAKGGGSQVSESAHSWPRHSAVVMHSSGIRDDWDFTGLEGVLKSDPAIIAGWLIRDFARSSDISIVVVKRD